MKKRQNDTADASVTITIRFLADDATNASRAVMHAAAARAATRIDEMLFYLAVSSISDAATAHGVEPSGYHEASVVLVAGPCTLYRRKPGDAALH
jgi:hypothetical protein